VAERKSVDNNADWKSYWIDRRNRNVIHYWYCAAPENCRANLRARLGHEGKYELERKGWHKEELISKATTRQRGGLDERVKAAIEPYVETSLRPLDILDKVRTELWQSEDVRYHRLPWKLDVDTGTIMLHLTAAHAALSIARCSRSFGFPRRRLVCEPVPGARVLAVQTRQG